MELPLRNAQYIQQLNKNNQILEKNIALLTTQVKSMEEGLNSVARDAAAMQRAVISFLKEKGLIESEDDLRLLQKLHMKNIAQLDQEITKRKAERDGELSE